MPTFEINLWDNKRVIQKVVQEFDPNLLDTLLHLPKFIHMYVKKDHLE